MRTPAGYKAIECCQVCVVQRCSLQAVAVLVRPRPRSVPRAPPRAPPTPTPAQIAAAHPTALLRQSVWKQRSCLHIAARAGSLEALCAVLDVAAHRETGSLAELLNAPDYAGDTALALACRNG